MPNNKNVADIKIFKFDPAKDKEPRYDTYKIPYEGRSVINILDDVYRNYDQDLAYRYGCEGKGDCRCGACAIQVNGLPALACRRPAEKEMIIEPHPKFEIIKDLVMNFNKVKQDLPHKDPSVSITIDPDKCVKCADCISICPVGVYEAKKGKIEPSGAEFCCSETCNQCVSYCQTAAISIEIL
ncbi:MAG: 2Fe-2S iron-sulfur cluster-binding protein, partial [Thermodesulfobacteriota bacterium]|nr:2Fe-2S iron-sulfur cluster-binding protein [Thermodesulfobacteriota bacterium]